MKYLIAGILPFLLLGFSPDSRRTVSLSPGDRKISQTPQTPKIIYHDQVMEMPGLPIGPFVRLKTGEIFTVGTTESFISRDEGKTWKTHEIFDMKMPIPYCDRKEP